MSKQQERDEQLADLWRVLTETHEPSHRARRKPGEETSLDFFLTDTLDRCGSNFESTLAVKTDRGKSVHHC